MEMTSLNVSLPKVLKEYVEGQATADGYSTPSEYIRELIRDDRKRQAKEKLEAALLQGLNSGPAKAITPAQWAQKRSSLRQPHKPARITG
jgi:antitoxin ParD1/3/4